MYEIQGDTETEYKVSDAQDFHGATFGKEVDDEPNVPEWADKVSQTNLISVPISNPVEEVVDLENNSSEKLAQEESVINSNDSILENNIEEVPKNENLCPICMSESEKGASTCLVCGYSFK